MTRAGEPRPLADRFVDLLPEDGRPMFYGELMRRAREGLHLSSGAAGAVLVLLCSDRRAISEVRGSFQFVRRLPVHAELPVARPQHQPRPLARTRHHATPMRKAAA